ncbi:Remorin, C-terminal [Sesbania bispinosa]|nr:Remorin, C-terminal [Sesbania bispinosa]
MGEEGKQQSQCDQCVSSAVVTASPPQVLQDPFNSHLLLKEKEPENADATSSGVKREEDPLPKYQATPSPDQIPAARTEPIDSINRDAVLARVESEKRLALIRAWEESEKTKVENKAYKLHSAVGLWENKKKASTEAKLKIIEEKMDKKKAGRVEIMQNKVAEIHRLAEEKRAIIEAQKGEEFLKVEETAAKYRTRGYVPRKLLLCFGI